MGEASRVYEEWSCAKGNAFFACRESTEIVKNYFSLGNLLPQLPKKLSRISKNLSLIPKPETLAANSFPSAQKSALKVNKNLSRASKIARIASKFLLKLGNLLPHVPKNLSRASKNATKTSKFLANVKKKLVVAKPPESWTATPLEKNTAPRLNVSPPRAAAPPAYIRIDEAAILAQNA